MNIFTEEHPQYLTTLLRELVNFIDFDTMQYADAVAKEVMQGVAEDYTFYQKELRFNLKLLESPMVKDNTQLTPTVQECILLCDLIVKNLRKQLKKQIQQG